MYMKHFGTRYRERQSAKPEGHYSFYSVFFVVKQQFQRLISRGLSDHGHLLFFFIPSALRAFLSLSSPCRTTFPLSV